MRQKTDDEQGQVGFARLIYMQRTETSKQKHRTKYGVDAALLIAVRRYRALHCQTRTLESDFGPMGRGCP